MSQRRLGGPATNIEQLYDVVVGCVFCSISLEFRVEILSFPCRGEEPPAAVVAKGPAGSPGKKGRPSAANDAGRQERVWTLIGRLPREIAYQKEDIDNVVAHR